MLLTFTIAPEIIQVREELIQRLVLYDIIEAAFLNRRAIKPQIVCRKESIYKGDLKLHDVFLAYTAG